MNRYQQLKKENDLLLNQLGTTYAHIATIYIKKARGYAVRNEDTEVKIRDTLYILQDYEQKNIPYGVAITNDSEFIESRIKLLSKQYKDPDMIKGYIILVLLIIGCVAWFGITKYLARTVELDPPTNFVVSNVNNNKVTLKWDASMYAQGYTIYYTVDDSINHSSSYKTEKLEYTLNLERNHTYTFYLYANKTSNFKESEVISIKYKLL